MCQVVEQVRLNTPGSVSDVADNWFLCSLSKRDWAGAEQALAALGDNPCWSDQVLQCKRQFGEGLLARAMHDVCMMTLGPAWRSLPLASSRNS